MICPSGERTARRNRDNQIADSALLDFDKSDTVSVFEISNFFRLLLLLYHIQPKSQGMKQLMAGGGVALIGITLVPLLSGLFTA